MHCRAMGVATERSVELVKEALTFVTQTIHNVIDKGFLFCTPAGCTFLFMFVRSRPFPPSFFPVNRERHR
jgi:hypothetical protein